MSPSQQASARGFDNPVMNAQAVFRATLAAMAAPGSMRPSLQIPQAPFQSVMAALALTLLDYETPYALIGLADERRIESYLSFHTGAGRADASKAMFAFIDPRDLTLQLWQALPHGAPDYPDTSATIILDAGHFGAGLAVELSGPGLAAPRPFCASNLTHEFWDIAVGNAALYPLGVDFIFCGDSEIAALPRSTRIRLIGETS